MAADDLTPKQLRLFSDGDNRNIDSVSEDVYTEIRRFQRRLISIFNQALREADFSGPTAQRLAEANLLAAELDEFLVQAGVDDLLDNYRRRHANITRRAMEYFTFVEMPDTLTGPSIEALDFMIQGNVSELFNQIDRSLVEPLNTALLQNTFATRPADEIVRNVSNAASDLSSQQVEVLVNDTYRRFHNAVRGEHAEELGLEVVFYSGPNDERTSTQCRAALEAAPYGAEGIWLKDEFTASNLNKFVRPKGKRKPTFFTDDPLVARGHFNCRHNVFFMSQRAAERNFGAKF